MRHAAPALLGLILSVGLAPHAAAQPVASPTIHRVTVQPDAGVLTITGTGLGPDLQVTVDGQPVPQLSGATDTQVEVLAPVTVLTMPGTYRLMVVDPMRRVGDTFVVASPMGSLATAGDAQPERSSGVSRPVTRSGTSVRGAAPGTRTTPQPKSGQASPNLVEGTTNTAVGQNALVNNTTGTDNTAIGAYALYTNTTGYWNTANGFQALVFNTTGAKNTASGVNALLSNTNGDNNTATGYQSLTFNTTGTNNTATGANALVLNTTGSNNTASGLAALASNTTGAQNTASGLSALFNNTTGKNNTASGVEALRSNTDGGFNTANGSGALWSNTQGWGNTASGSDALRSNTTGGYNTASGNEALYSNTTGYWNMASGGNALFANTTGVENTASGYVALYANATGSANTANGVRALQFNTTGAYNTAMGVDALRSNSTGGANTAIGHLALVSSTTGVYNTASGREALRSNTTGVNNTATGYLALGFNSTGSSNVAVGDHAGTDATTGSYNVYVGSNVTGTVADTNTIRIGLPYDSASGMGQNQTFIAGIWGNHVTGTAAQVFVDANGKLGTGTPVAILSGTGTIGSGGAPGTTLLSLVNANGGFVAPVTDTSSDTASRWVRVALDVNGHLALVDVRQNRWMGNTTESIWFETNDCTGPAHIRSADGEGSIFPLAVAAGSVPGAQVLYVADNTATMQTLAVQSSRSLAAPGCVVLGSPQLTYYLLPVVATLDLSTLGPSPYRVVRTP